MPTPLEIISGPLELYWAPTGEAFTAITSAPAGNWTLIGASGADNYTEDGVVVVSNQTIENFRGLGSSGPVKGFRTEEDLMIRVTIADLTLETVRLAFNQNTVTPDSPITQKTLGLHRSPGAVAQIAILVRGTNNSPYDDTLNLQFEVPVCSHTASFETAFTKTPASLVLEFQAYVDPNASSDDEKFGRLIAGTT